MREFTRLESSLAKSDCGTAVLLSLDYDTLSDARRHSATRPRFDRNSEAGRHPDAPNRAGSAPIEELKRSWSELDPLAAYALPHDVPAGDRARLRPQQAPSRLLFVQRGDRLQTVAQVCYRAGDVSASSRSSYFGHFLYVNPAGREAWTALDCLELWGARGWVCEDSAEIPDDPLPALADLGQFLDGHPPVVCERRDDALHPQREQEPRRNSQYFDKCLMRASNAL